MTSQLVEKAESREKERQREETKKQKKLDSAFKALLKNAAPPLDVNSVWEEVQIRNQNALVFVRFYVGLFACLAGARAVRERASVCGVDARVGSRASVPRLHAGVRPAVLARLPPQQEEEEGQRPQEAQRVWIDFRLGTCQFFPYRNYIMRKH